jgi:hypothetical protein
VTDDELSDVFAFTKPDGSVGVGWKDEGAVGLGYCDNDCCREEAPLGTEHCRGYPVLPFD